MEVTTPVHMRIIDDVLPIDIFNQLKQHVLTSPWNICTNVSGMNEEKYCYFHHTYYHKGPTTWTTPQYNQIKHIIDTIIPMHMLIRVKANLYPRTDHVHHHQDHVDYTTPNKGAILYLNTNDGYTVVDGHPVESIANRLLLFNPQILHHSTTCANQQYRLNININYL